MTTFVVTFFNRVTFWLYIGVEAWLNRRTFDADARVYHVSLLGAGFFRAGSISTLRLLAWTTAVCTYTFFVRAVVVVDPFG